MVTKAAAVEGRCSGSVVVITDPVFVESRIAVGPGQESDGSYLTTITRWLNANKS